MEIDSNAVMTSPQVDELTGKLGAVISNQVFRAPRWRTVRLKTIDYVLALKPLTNLDHHALANKDTDHPHAWTFVPLPS